MKETDIEKYSKEELAKMGYRLLKWVSPGETGVPDRIVEGPKGYIEFIEFKKPGGVLSERQKLWGERLIEDGHRYTVINNKQEAREYVGKIRAMAISG